LESGCDELIRAPLAVYLHVPFCRTKCTYCAFNTYTNQEHLFDAFVTALCREIRSVGERAPDRQVSTIFFGGGTPSLLRPEQIANVLETVGAQFVVASDAEISLEANPNDIDLAYARGLRQAGINRISLGMQSANKNELALFARRHDNDQTAQAVSALRAAGFDDLNLDLIYGIPHQTIDDWAWSLKQMLALQPDHISLYALGLEDGTPMQDWVARGRLPVPDDDLAADMYDLATDMLARAGYAQYEISNWAKPGHACKHNLQYWRNLPYLGLGPGAHGYAGDTRYAVLLSPQRYIRALAGEADGAVRYPLSLAADPNTVVRVDRHSEMAETLIMGLRLTEEGIERSSFRARFGIDLLDAHGPVIDRYTRYGLLDVTEQRVRLTRAGRLLSNTIFRELV
jgi:oxygen-independent coproporphyrinogen-3 oxidase